jgi:hypothetical protein
MAICVCFRGLNVLFMRARLDNCDSEDSRCETHAEVSEVIRQLRRRESALYTIGT